VFCITLKSSILTKKEGPGDDGGRCAIAYENHWLPGFNFNVEEWFEGDRYETLAICRTLELAHAAWLSVRVGSDDGLLRPGPAGQAAGDASRQRPPVLRPTS
jgi:hypothetical protein